MAGADRPGAETGLAVLGGVVIVVGGFAILPAFGGFLQVGGWPKVRGPVLWAAGVTAVAAGAVTWLALTPGKKTLQMLNHSMEYFLATAGTGLLLAIALGLWTSLAAAMVKHAGRSRRRRGKEKVLAAVAMAAASAMVNVIVIWLSALNSLTSLFLIGLVGLFSSAYLSTGRIRRAIRAGRRVKR